MMIVCLLNFPAKTIFVKNDKQSSAKHNTKKTFGMFIKPSIIALSLFVIFPILLVFNYQNILFPLFMDDAGMSKTYINNIVVFASIIVFAITPLVSNKLKDVDA